MSTTPSRPKTPPRRPSSLATHYSPNFPGPGIIRQGLVAERIHEIRQKETLVSSAPASPRTQLSPLKETFGDLISTDLGLPPNQPLHPFSNIVRIEGPDSVRRNDTPLVGVVGKSSPAPSWSDKEVVGAVGGRHKAVKKDRELLAKSEIYSRFQRKFKSLEDFSRAVVEQELNERPSTAASGGQETTCSAEQRYKQSQSKSLMDQLDNMLDDALQEHTRPTPSSRRSRKDARSEEKGPVSPIKEGVSDTPTPLSRRRSTVLRRRSTKTKSTQKPAPEDDGAPEVLRMNPNDHAHMNPRKGSSTTTTIMPAMSPKTPAWDHEQNALEDEDPLPEHALHKLHNHLPIPNNDGLEKETAAQLDEHGTITEAETKFAELQEPQEPEMVVHATPDPSTQNPEPPPTPSTPPQTSYQPESQSKVNTTARKLSPWPFSWRLVSKDKKLKADASSATPSPPTADAPAAQSSTTEDDGQKTSPPTSDKHNQSTPTPHYHRHSRVATGLRANPFIIQDRSMHAHEREFQFENKTIRLSITKHEEVDREEPSRQDAASSSIPQPERVSEEGPEDPFEEEPDRAMSRKSTLKRTTNGGGYTITVEVRSGEGTEQEVFRLTAVVTPRGSKPNSESNSGAASVK